MGNKRKEKVEGNCFRLKEVEYTILNRIQYGESPLDPELNQKLQKRHFQVNIIFLLFDLDLKVPN